MADEDKSLDVTSEQFDPLKALYSRNVRLPNPEAPVLDNIHKYRSTLDPAAKKQPKKEKGQGGNEEGPSTSSQPPRRFLPHQEPVQGYRRQRTTRNVLTRIKEMTGPLSLLTDCMERRVRIKVFIRNMSGVRGYCLAFLAAYDKHWNLALEDVREVWTRRKRNKVKVPALGDPSGTISRVPRPRVAVLKTEGNMETCERHVDQLLVRGEQVALIAVHPT